MATANIKDVKRRMKSVESTMQITKAMELVASSKLRKAKERAEACQPYFAQMYETMCDILSAKDFKSEFMSKRHLKASLIVVIAGDRGLAGGFNHNVLKMAQQRIDELNKKGETFKILPVGKKAVEYFSKRGYEVYSSYQNVAEELSFEDAESISAEIVKGFEFNKYGTVELLYTHFVSALMQTPESIAVLPVEGQTEAKSNCPPTIYEPSAEAVFDGIVPKYVTGLIYCAIVNSFVSEQAARRTAMESASDNASEMIDKLSLLYNRARQAQITQEINEIVAGSMFGGK